MEIGGFVYPFLPLLTLKGVERWCKCSFLLAFVMAMEVFNWRLFILGKSFLIKSFFIIYDAVTLEGHILKLPANAKGYHARISLHHSAILVKLLVYND